MTCPECGDLCSTFDQQPNDLRWARHLAIITLPSLLAAVISGIVAFLQTDEIIAFGHPTNRSEAWEWPLIISVLLAGVWFFGVTPVLITHVARQTRYVAWPSIVAAAASPGVCLGMLALCRWMGELLAKL